MPFLRFGYADDAARQRVQDAFYTETTRRGVLLHPNHHWYISAAMTGRGHRHRPRRHRGRFPGGGGGSEPWLTQGPGPGRAGNPHPARARSTVLTDHEPLDVLGLDSVALIAVVAELQQHSGMAIDDEAVFDPDVSIASLAEAMVGADPRLRSLCGVSRWRGWASWPRPGTASMSCGRRCSTGRRTGSRRPTHVPARSRWGSCRAPGPRRSPTRDRLLTLLELAAEEALADANVLDRGSVHLVVGTTDTGGNALSHALDNGRAGDPSALEGACVGNAARRAAAALGLGGSATVIGSASASGAVAVGHALDLLRAGEAEEVLVVGVDTISETGFHGLATLRTLGPDGCRPFSSERRGIGISEAAAAVLLRRRASPQPGGDGPVRGRLAGYGASSRATHLASPEAEGIELALRRALSDAGLEPSDISFVNAHGPGTKLGDVAETDALRAVFGDGAVRDPARQLEGGPVALPGCRGRHRVAGVPAVPGARRAHPDHGSGARRSAVRGPGHRARGHGSSAARYAVSVSCGLGGVNTALVWERT